MANKIFQAVWKDQVLAESDNCILLEGNVYFPPATVRNEFFRNSETHTFCNWKGEAGYYDVLVDNEIIHDAAWYYPSPYEKAGHIKNYVAFWNREWIKERYG